MVFGKQDTHVDRAGRSLIRDTLDEGGGAVSVSTDKVAVWGKRNHEGCSS